MRSPRSRPWTAPPRCCPCSRAGSGRRTHEYTRHGTSTLFAALEVATGRVTAACKPRHRSTELLVFLRQVTRAYPDDELHLVMDNYATHKTPEVRAWLEANPRVHVHLTPTSASWLNMVEIFLSVIDRAAIRRGVFTSVKDLNTKIRAFINGWNQRCHPFTWTKTPDEILTKYQPKTNYQHKTLVVVGYEVVVMGCWGQRGLGCQDGWC